MPIPAAGRTGLYRNDWLVACTGRMYTGRISLYWTDQLVLERSACTGRIGLAGRIGLYRKDQLVQEGSACTERISLYRKDQLVQEGSACVSLYCDLPGLCTTLRWSWLFTGLCITLLWPFWFVYHSPVTFLVCVSLSCDLYGLCITLPWPFWFVYHSEMTSVVHQLVCHSPVASMACVWLWDDLRGPLACLSCLLCLCSTGSSPGHVTSMHQAEGVLTWTVQHAHWRVRSEQLECDASVYGPACQWIPSSHCSAWACELCSAWLDYLPSLVGWNSVSSLFLAQ